MKTAEIVSINAITAQQVASITDHTFLKTEDAFSKGEDGPIKERRKAFATFLDEIPSLQPYAVCVRHYDVKEARSSLDSQGLKDTRVAATVGFPDADRYVQLDRPRQMMVIDEMNRARDEGAKEADFVLPSIGVEWSQIERYVDKIHRTARSLDLTTKMIIEVCDNTPHRIKMACRLAEVCDIDFVKTSTGYAHGGATESALDLMRHSFGRGIKISGKVTTDNYKSLLTATSRTDDGLIVLDPKAVRIGASGLLPALYKNETSGSGY